MRLHASLLAVAVLAFAAPARGEDAAPARGAETGTDAPDAPDAQAAPPALSLRPVLVGVGGEIGFGSSKAAPSTPATSFLYERASSRWAFGSRLELSASLTLNEDFAAAPQKTTGFVSTGDTVLSASAGATYTASDHVDLGLTLSGSPSSSRDVATSITVQDPSGGHDADALLHVASSSAGATAAVTYDSAGDDAREVDVAIDASAGVTRFGTQQIVGETAAGEPSAASFPRSDASLVQARLGAGATFTFADDTDVGVSGAYYVYDTKHPGDVGMFTVLAGSGASYGAGPPTLPPSWSVRPEIGRRFGDVSLRASYEFTDLAVDGVAHGAGLRATLSLGKVKLFASGSWRGTVFTDATSQTWSGSVGITGRL